MERKQGITRIRDSAGAIRRVPYGIKPALKKSVVKEKSDSCKCSACGKTYLSQAVSFFQTKSPLYKNNNGRLPFCKECTEAFYKKTVELFEGDEMLALEYCCRVFDWYYNQEIANETIHSGVSKRIGVYFSKMTLPEYFKRGTRYRDTIREAQESSLLEGDDPGRSSDEDDWRTIDEVPQSVVRFFGAGYLPAEYSFLNAQYHDWAQRYECKTKAQEELFKSICIAQLVIQRVQKNGSTKEITDAMKTFQDLLGTANLKPAQAADAASGDQVPFGVMIKRLEKERPVAEPTEEWKDVDGINRYIDTYFLGHLCKLLHVNNDYEREYEEEMAKHTVTPPVYEEDEEGETSLLDKYSDRSERSAPNDD